VCEKKIVAVAFCQVRDRQDHCAARRCAPGVRGVEVRRTGCGGAVWDRRGPRGPADIL